MPWHPDKRVGHQNLRLIDHRSFHEPQSALLCDTKLDYSLARFCEMLAPIRLTGRSTIGHVWQNLLSLRLFSISSAKSGSWSKDPETRRRQYDRFQARQRYEYAQNADEREKRVMRVRARKAAWSEPEKRVFYQRNAFTRWVARGLRNGDVRSWKTHTPELAEKSNAQLCSGCNKLHRKTLWWKRHNESEVQYDVCAILAILLETHKSSLKTFLI